MQLRDTLALKDFVSDVKSMIYRRAWEGVSPHSPGGRLGSEENEELLRDGEELSLSAYSSGHVSGGSLDSDTILLVANRSDDVMGSGVSSTLERNVHDDDESHIETGHNETGMESDIELIESVLTEALLSTPPVNQSGSR